MENMNNMQGKTINFIFTLVTGHPEPSTKGNFVDDIWDYEPGVMFFTKLITEDMPSGEELDGFPPMWFEMSNNIFFNGGF